MPIIMCRGWKPWSQKRRRKSTIIDRSAGTIISRREKEFGNIVSKIVVRSLTGMNLPENDDNCDTGILPGRDFSAAKSVNAAQVYLDLLAYLTEYGKMKRIISCYSPGSRERLFALINDRQSREPFWASLGLPLPTVGKKRLTRLISARWRWLCLACRTGFAVTACAWLPNRIFWGPDKTAVPSKGNVKEFYRGHFRTQHRRSGCSYRARHRAFYGAGKHYGRRCAARLPEDYLCQRRQAVCSVENIETVSRYGIDDDNIQLDTLGGSASGEAKRRRSKNVFTKLP